MKREMPSDKNDSFSHVVANSIADYVAEVRTSLRHLAGEVQSECLPQSTVTPSSGAGGEMSARIHQSLKYFGRHHIHIPFLPAFHRPGWLLRYTVGPYDIDWVTGISSDIRSGLTVAFTLIPQSFSYASLANLPPIAGLYSSIMALFAYSMFGTSMTLSVGPVSLVSLLVGELVSKYVPNYDTDDGATSAMAFASEVCVAVGVVLIILSLFNCGDVIRYISHSVISGFTTGAALVIGLNQLKNAFGFNVSVPQVGQEGYAYNYQVMQWFIQNWNGVYSYSADQTASNPVYALYNGNLYRNSYATQICFGTYVSLFVFAKLKENIKATPERSKSWAFFAWQTFVSLTPLLSIIIGAHAAWTIMHNNSIDQNPTYDAYTLKTIGAVSQGLNIIQLPKITHNFGELCVSALSIILISFMESYSCARRLAIQRKELHLLNASQEMFAVGMANLLTSVASGYPVAGALSRSALSSTSGCRTPLTSIVTMLVVLLALSTLANSFYYIPQASLAAVIFVAIGNLIYLSDFWETWKHSKSDFFVIFVTCFSVFVFNTELGLLVGVGASCAVFLLDILMLTNAQPKLVETVHDDDNDSGIDVVKVSCDVTFLTVPAIRDVITSLTLTQGEKQQHNNQNDEPTSRVPNKAFVAVSSLLDRMLTRKQHFVDELPKAIVLDMQYTRVVDFTGLDTLAELMHQGREKGVKFVIINVAPALASQFTKFGLYNDCSIEGVKLDKYLKLSSLSTLPVVGEPEVVRTVSGFAETSFSSVIGTKYGSGILYAELAQDDEGHPS